MERQYCFAARAVALVLGLILGGLPSWAAADVYAGHQAVAGDFNGDGWADFILQPLAGYRGVGEFIAYQDGNFGAPFATWKDKRGGTDWNADAHRIVVGDFTGNGRDGLILQAAAGLPSEEYFAKPDGSFPPTGAPLPATLGGLDLSQATHRLVVGDFNGDGRADLLLQANTFVGTDGIALANKGGSFTVLTSSWNDGALGLAWSADRAALVSGSFAGDGHDELLTRSLDAAGSDTCCRIVSLGARLAPQKIHQAWAANWLGINWRPQTANVIVADLNGDGRADLLVQPRAPGGDVYVLLAGAGGTFSSIADRWSSERDGVDWSAQSYRLVFEHGTHGKGASLAMIPKQVGLPWRRASFDASGQLTGVVSLKIPPSGALAAVAGDSAGGGAGGGVEPHASGGLAPNAGPLSGNTVGAMAGKASVSNGAAGYSIPIVVPPGRAGMAPQLSLSYASNGGDGHEGVGWSLGGFSAIYRCPATWASDGATRGTTFARGD